MIATRADTKRKIDRCARTLLRAHERLAELDVEAFVDLLDAVAVVACGDDHDAFDLRLIGERYRWSEQ
jgi:hypothetical protein